MMNAFVVGGVALALVGAPPAVGTRVGGDVLPPSEKIVVDLVTVNGSGCPKGSTAVAVAPDNTAFTVTYSKFLAQVGVGAKPTDSRKNCQLAVQVHVPEGFTYAIVKADYRGFANLAKGAKASQQANYYFQGMSATEHRKHTFKGPMVDNWQTTDTADIGSMSWAPCGETRYLNVNTELRVDRGTSNLARSTSFISMDSTDTTISTKYHFAWKRCSSRGTS